MKTRLPALLVVVLCLAPAAGRTEVLGSITEGQRLPSRLDAFLAGAAVNDAAVHEAFWAEELVYTSSSGTRFGKTQLMSGVHEGGPVSEEDVDAR